MPGIGKLKLFSKEKKETIKENKDSTIKSTDVEIHHTSPQRESSDSEEESFYNPPIPDEEEFDTKPKSHKEIIKEIKKNYVAATNQQVQNLLATKTNKTILSIKTEEENSHHLQDQLQHANFQHVKKRKEKKTSCWANIFCCVRMQKEDGTAEEKQTLLNKKGNGRR